MNLLGITWPSMDLLQILTLTSQFFQGIGGISFLFTTWIALKVYKRQKQDTEERLEREKRDTEERLKREVRLRLTQAYYNLDNEVLNSRQNIETMRELVFAKYNSHQVERIMFVYTILDILYLEWRFQSDYGYTGAEFPKNLDALFGRIVKNIKKREDQDSFLIDDFESIFEDFPDDFKAVVRSCINRHTENGSSV